ncbi:N-6 DNA methylase [Amycolatopsis azurea]|uniref:class I SAM-dependent DNA methyltransferase n=1 Tax=Amycolatopsis azurea TaxID=36819 RepID=UPI00380919B1
MSDLRQLTNLVWSISDLLRGAFKSSEYGSMLMPFTALRRLEAVRAGGATLAELAASPPVTADALARYVDTFAPNVREVLEGCEFPQNTSRLDQAGVLHQVVAGFAAIDLRRETVSDDEMGEVFDDLVRGHTDRSVDMAGEHSTPPDVAKLMAQLLLAHDSPNLTTAGATPTVLDPACGSGGLLDQVEKHVAAVHPTVNVGLFGQEINSEYWAICRLRMLVEGRSPQGIELGNILADDRHADRKFDFLASVPPFGVEWKRSEASVRQEHDELGMAGRFGAGLPRINDGSLLFLQHMLSKMKPSGSRVVMLLNESAMQNGRAGSGESEIRRWIIENDWLECVVALPARLLYNTAIPTYLWTLTNHKAPDRRGKVVLVDARSQSEQMRKPLGDKRRYLTNEQISHIVRTCLDLPDSPVESDHPLREKAQVVDNNLLGHQSITIQYPLRLRFELTDATLDALANTRTVRGIDDIDGVLTSLRRMTGTVWAEKQSALVEIERAVLASGRTWPTDPAFHRAVTKAIGVPHPEGTIQQSGGVALPDRRRSHARRVPLDTDLDEYLRQNVLLDAPDAWLDADRTQIGYSVSPMLFFNSTLDTRFVPLHDVAEKRYGREGFSDDDIPTHHLRNQDLHTVNRAEELPEAPEENGMMTVCEGGDLVGRGTRWRALPPEFGAALTSLFVLRPRGPYGSALGEWLSSRTDYATSLAGQRHPPDDLPVPIDLISDDLLDGLLSDLRTSRRTVQEVVSNLLPNVFSDSKQDVRHFREGVRSIAAQAALVGEFASSVVDPVWQAEWSYPFHVAALARRYRLSSQPAERKDALLKLGEGISRTVGILILSEFVDSGRLPDAIGKTFASGATFGTWLSLTRRFMHGTTPTKMRELAELKDNARLVELLQAIKDVRNDTSHAHGVRAEHQLEREIEELEPLVAAALTAANWLSAVPWDWVQRCEYLDEHSYLLVGQRLRGSHPDWEPFERSSTYPLRPRRLYAGTDIADTGQPVDLSPLAAVQICADCGSRELFLVNKIKGDDITLRSLEDHSADGAQQAVPTADGETAEYGAG